MNLPPICVVIKSVLMNSSLITSKFTIFVDLGGNADGIEAFFARSPLITSKFKIFVDLGGNTDGIEAFFAPRGPLITSKSA